MLCLLCLLLLICLLCLLFLLFLCFDLFANFAPCVFVLFALRVLLRYKNVLKKTEPSASDPKLVRSSQNLVIQRT